MAGETNLAALLSGMQPILRPEEFVFVSFPDGKYGDGTHMRPIGMFSEKEGMTLILDVKQAIHNNLSFDGRFRCISLTVHSSLEAVGLTAAISKVLAEHDISANVVAAYYHDHVFVPADKAQQAMACLESFS